MQQSNRQESKRKEGRKTVAGAEERGAGAGKDLEEEKGDNMMMNNEIDQQHATNQKNYGGRRKTETVAAKVMTL